MGKRIKHLIGLILALNIILASVKAVDVKSFTDYSNINPEYQEAIAYVTNLKILQGYLDGSFKPEYRLTRGAAAKIIASIALGTEVASALGTNKAPFSDVEITNVFAGYIAYCAAQGYINGYADGSFKPSAPLSGYAFAKMLLNVINDNGASSQYTGNNWQVAVYRDALQKGIFTKTMSFNPNSGTVSREEAAWLTYNALVQEDHAAENTESETDISTVDGLEDYLNETFSTCETPMGKYALKFDVSENTYDFNGWDIEIRTEGDYSVLPWAQISSSIKYTEEEKAETLEIFKTLQEEIYKIACDAFPNKKLTGCYFSDWYKYPYLEVGYETDRHLTWSNYAPDGYSNYRSTYITTFHWDDSRDN